MANVSNQQVFTWDGIGVYVPGPFRVRKAVLYPSAAGDACELKTCNLQSIRSQKYSQTCTVTGSNQIASAGNFTAANVVVGDVIQIYESNSLNVGWYIVATRADDNTITVVGTPLTNDAGKVYSWKVYVGFSAGPILTQATNKLEGDRDFGPNGYDFPGGLGLLSLSASAKLYIYR
jgi:hypothetical protein